MAIYELAPSSTSVPQVPGVHDGGMASAVLRRNVLWFTKIRWVTVAVALLVGLVSLLAPAKLRSLGIVPPVFWPWLMGFTLAAANTGFCFLVGRLGEAPSRVAVEANIWLQIVLDLLLLTVLVHIVGSIDSLIACVYLLHITLACVFFGRKESLLVTALAAVLYLGCVGLEISGVLPARSIFAYSLTVQQRGPVPAVLVAGFSVVLWVAVWYLVGTLSQAVRERDSRLDAANRELVAADERMNRQVLRTTHDLKAPFSGIESNIQVLRMKYSDSLPPEVRDILARIERRGQTLSRRIGDILLLGDLRSQKSSGAPEPVDLGAAIDAAVDNVKERADSRGIVIDAQAPAVSVAGDQRRFAILFSNLLSNAVSYSLDGGQVEVRVKREDGRVHVSVADHGIGIEAEALPHVFDEYFRTKEAMQANAMSTGLGLAIVKKIAQDFGLGLRVTSEPGSGTVFDVTLPLHSPATGDGKGEACPAS